ncbi:glycosyltransferase family 4 protein [Flaviramulus sp. BrNp1-15]|uniref:glycosyltransferase family 4 protein n=1 Tax=Flaviramulus sp. BrNp1-15 TaxID=2916754 RepID=UPI001EE7B133|nr:glycosyltransferase family 4 protein [Flaviramulus sp. BrNp1-15]ULC58280.1 glycosyltransferase family 4 protein [Flaviramulus sp. BrNp1-15]
MKKKLIRVTTVPASMGGLLKGQLKFMSNNYEVIGVSSKNNKQLELVSKSEEIPTVAIEMTRQITPLKDLTAVWKLYKLFKKEKPFIVHSHTPKAGTVSMIASRLAGVPHRLHTIAGLPLVETVGLKRIILNMVEKITYGCATRIYPNSYGLMDIILENNFTKKDKLKVIANGSSNGIDTLHFNPELYTKEDKSELRKSLNIEKNDYVYIFVGRLVSDKGINELIAAFNSLSKNNSSIKLLLVGNYETELDPLLPETLKIISTNTNIISTGFVKDVRPYFAISNALAFPSYREGFPNVVMQAGAMKLPSIVTNINGCNEIIINQETGIIIPVKNEQALYDAMLFLYRKQEEVKNMGAKSRERIVSKYERKNLWLALLEEYKSLD